MIIKNREIQYLITLLSCVFNDKKVVEESDVNYHTLFTLAKEQQVYNIIAPLVENFKNITNEDKELWHNYCGAELIRTIAVNNDRELILSEFEKNDINYMLLKGLVIKNYYKKTSMRQMSDNDILYDYSKRDKLLKIMKGFSYKLDTCCENSDDFVKEPYYTFEFHRELFFDEHDFCPKFENLWQNATKNPNKKNEYIISKNDNYIYSVAHMYKHYSTNGCGIRFLCDIYLILKKDKDELDFEYINKSFKDMGILDFANEVVELSYALFDDKKIDDKFEKMLGVLFGAGVYGDFSKALNKKYEDFKNSSKSQKGLLFKYTLKRIFPPKKKMVADYKILEKKPYLLLFFYIKRLFRRSSKKSSVFSEIKAIKKLNSEEKEDDK